MDQDLRREVLDVRKVIEKSTSKVSLRDLEKKGFRQVKVLRAGDINQLIMKAVQSVMAKQGGGAGMSEEERGRIMKEAKAELDRSMADKRQIQQAHANLQAKLQEVNQKLLADKQAFEAEKASLAREKQALMERSLEGQKVASTNYESQIADLKRRLEAASGGVSREEYDGVRKRYSIQIEDLEGDVERYRSKVKSLQEQLDNGGGAGAGVSADAQAEMQRMRMEFEQSQSRMQDMMSGIANSLMTAKSGPAEAPDMSKQFKMLQQNISDAVRKAAGAGAKGGADFDLTAEQAAALFANMQDVELTTNINDVEVKSQKAASVSGKLNKLRNMRKK